MHARCFATVIFSVHLFLVCEFLFRKLWYVKIFNFNLTCVWIFLKKILLWLINPCKPMIVHCVSVMINKASYALECLVYVTFSYAINLEYWSCDESCNSSVLHRSPLINTFRYTVTAYQWGTMILLATSPFFLFISMFVSLTWWFSSYGALGMGQCKTWVEMLSEYTFVRLDHCHYGQVVTVFALPATKGPNYKAGQNITIIITPETAKDN